MGTKDDEKQVDMVLSSIKKEEKNREDKKNNSTEKDTNKIDKKQKNKEQFTKESSNKKQNTGVVIDPNSQEDDSKTYRGYYLKNENIDQLNYISDRTGKDKSQLVNMALEFFFDNLTIKD